MTDTRYTGLNGAIVDNGFNYQAPATGFSITIANSDWHVVLNPAGVLATGTLTMPALPLNGQIVDVRTSNTITALTVSPNSGQSVSGNPATLAAGKSFSAIYRAANTTWYIES